jgi:MFS family permease
LGQLVFHDQHLFDNAVEFFGGTEAGSIFGTAALACILSPFFVGMVADRFFSTERVLCALHLLGAGLALHGFAGAYVFSTIYPLMLIYCLCYFPTLALTTSITLKNCPRPAAVSALPGVWDVLVGLP